jgi:hypothetical protein
MAGKPATTCLIIQNLPMKIITANRRWNIDELFKTLLQNINPLFKKIKQEDIHFNVIKEGDTIEINQPDLYEGYLFRLTAEGNKLNIAKSEHYVDDVNWLTLENILETLQMGIEDGADIVYISGE